MRQQPLIRWYSQCWQVVIYGVFMLENESVWICDQASGMMGVQTWARRCARHGGVSRWALLGYLGREDLQGDTTVSNMLEITGAGMHTPRSDWRRLSTPLFLAPIPTRSSPQLNSMDTSYVYNPSHSSRIFPIIICPLSPSCRPPICSVPIFPSQIPIHRS